MAPVIVVALSNRLESTNELPFHFVTIFVVKPDAPATATVAAAAPS